MDVTAAIHAFEATIENFETDVLQASMQTPVLVDFWAEWCGPCKALGPVLDKLVMDYNGAFALAKVDVDRERELASAFQIRSIPTIVLVKGGQPVDGFPGALPEAQVREFLKRHGIVPAAPPAQEPDIVENQPETVDPHAEVLRVRSAVASASEQDAPRLRLDLALALLRSGAAHEAEQILDALPANLATDDRAIRARAHLGFLSLVRDAPAREVLEAAIAADPSDLKARHLLGVRQLVEGEPAKGLDQFLEMLRRDRAYADNLPKRSLIDAFRIVDDADLVGTYRRKMSSLIF